MCLGHIRIRQLIPKCIRGKDWSAWSSIFLTTLHPVSMIISSITIRVNGFYPSFGLTFAIWTMRPRMFGPLLCWIMACCFQRKTENAYLWTLKDSIIEESLLNVFSLPFALFFVIGHQSADDGTCVGDIHYQRFWSSFYIIIAAGGLSLFLLTHMLLHYCWCLKRSLKKPAGGPGAPQMLSGFWKWILTMGGLNMLVAFAGQWLLWGSKYSNSESSGIVASGRANR